MMLTYRFATDNEKPYSTQNVSICVVFIAKWWSGMYFSIEGVGINIDAEVVHKHKYRCVYMFIKTEYHALSLL